VIELARHFVDQYIADIKVFACCAVAATVDFDFQKIGRNEMFWLERRLDPYTLRFISERLSFFLT